MPRYKTVDEYLNALKKYMDKHNADKALTIDALYDAEEHLSIMVEELVYDEGMKEKEAVKVAIEQYGKPSEVGKVYIEEDRAEQLKKVKITRRKELKKRKKKPKGSLLYQMFSPYVQGRTYANLLYLFLMFPLGIIYFTWIVTGFSTGLGLVVTVIGIPLLILFLLSFLGIGWFHGRLSEALLGIRMPKKRGTIKTKGTVWQRLKKTLLNPRLYSTILYLFLIFPLGIIYFTMIVTMLSVSLALIGAPVYWILWNVYGVPVSLPMPLWLSIITSVFGVVVLTWSMHMINIIAYGHGKLTRLLLLRW